AEAENDSVEIPQNAFLIVNGVRIFPLDQAVVNIGRHPDNHLVLDDPRVSRQHAQLRAVRGHYLIFDLGSAGGTLVNNLRVRQATLSSGDVISLAGVPLVYGEDAQAVGGTRKLSLSSH
ncbi:MAG: FHA domain-containing protein, partial [Anaerolineales bacterium]